MCEKVEVLRIRGIGIIVFKGWISFILRISFVVFFVVWGGVFLF